MLKKICICKLSIEYAYNPIWIDIRLSRLPFLIDCDTFECPFFSSSLHTRVVGIAELVPDSERGTQHCHTSTVDSPTQPWFVNIMQCRAYLSTRPEQSEKILTSQQKRERA